MLISTVATLSRSAVAMSMSPYGTSYTPPAKIQRLMRLEPTLMKYIDRMSSPKIFALDDLHLRKIYLFELSLQKEQLEDTFSQMEYAYSDSQYTDYLQEIRTSAMAIRDILKEVQKVSSDKSNPFAINTTERSAVEADILTTQKDLVGYLKEMLQMYDGQDIKQTNPSIFHFESEMGTVDVNLEKNTSILSWVTGNNEADIKLTTTVDLKIPDDYNFDENGNYTPGAYRSVKWSLMFDGNMKTIDDEMYMTLNDYALELSGDMGDMSSKINEAKTLIDSIKGKTVRIELPENYGQPSAGKIITTMKTILDVLEEKPLLTPYKVWNGQYALEPKKSTLEAIWVAIETPLPASEFNDIRKEFHLHPVWYRDIDNGYEYMIRVNDDGTTGDVKLYSINEAYTFTSELTNKRGNKMSAKIQNGYLDFDMDDTAGEIHILWMDKNLDLKASWEGQVFSITGPLSTENTNLTISFNNETIGTIKATGTTTHSDYEINLGFNLPSPWKFSVKGTMDIEHGTFTIEKPTNAIDATSLMPETGSSVLDELDL